MSSSAAGAAPILPQATPHFSSSDCIPAVLADCPLQLLAPALTHCSGGRAPSAAGAAPLLQHTRLHFFYSDCMSR